MIGDGDGGLVVMLVEMIDDLHFCIRVGWDGCLIDLMNECSSSQTLFCSHV